MAPINCSQGEKEVGAGDAHQHTDEVVHVTDTNRKFSFPNKCYPLTPFFPWDTAPDTSKHCYEHTSLISAFH